MQHDFVRRRRKTRDASWVAAVLSVAASLVSCSSGVAVESADRSAYAAAVSYCRSKPNQLSLNEDRSIFCYDGPVLPERDVSSLEGLNSGGLFVVRSPGGHIMAAARIATLIEERGANIVVYDYCMSACAHFFLAAAPRAYILRDSIVAWHHGPGRWALLCDSISIRSLYGDRQATRDSCSELSQEQRRFLDELRSVADPFFKRRVIDLTRFNLESSPLSLHVATILRSKTEGTGYFPDVFWMWNPRYHKRTLRTEVVYEAYPETQEDVDVLTKRLFGKHIRSSYVLHDP